MSANRNDSSLAGQLPYWEFFSAPFGHIILNDGSLVAGLNLGLKDIECLDDAEINQFTFQLRSVLNSISEETSVQFHFKVDSDFTETITNHIKRKQPEAHQLILDIAAHRERGLRRIKRLLNSLIRYLHPVSRGYPSFYECLS